MISLVRWVFSFAMAYVFIMLINLDFNPCNWSDVWQATWLIVALQFRFYVGLKFFIENTDKGENK